MISVLGGLSSPPAVFGLDSDKRVTQYMHQAWKDELPHATVHDVLQTRDGYLWLATQEGLVRFDGVRFAVFTPRDTPQLASAHILTLFEDRRGALWIGTRGGGVVTYQDGRFVAMGGPGKVIFAIAGDRAGKVWLGTQNGLLCYDGNRWIRWGREAGLPDDSVRAILEDSRGDLWVGTRKSGLGRLQGGRFIPWQGAGDLSVEVALEGFGVVCLLEDRAGRLLIGTRNHGLLRLEGDHLTALASTPGLSDATVVDLTLDQDDNLWIATYGGGLVRFDGDRMVALTHADRLTSDVVLALFEDREGSLWVGTSGGGLNRLRDGTLTLYTTREGLAGDNTYCVLEDRSGVLWIGTEGGGLSRLENGRATTLTVADGLSSNSVTALLEDRRGDLWIGTRDAGLNVLQEGGVRVFSRRDGLSSESIFSLIEDAGGRIWIGTVRAGLSYFEDGRILPYLGDSNLNKRSIFALALDAEGRLLAGTDGAGLKIIGRDGVTTLSTADGLSNDTVVALHSESDGTVWAGTYGGGLNRIRGRQIVTIASANGLFDDRIFSILDDREGRLWMTSNRGIFSVDRSELEAFSEGLAPAVTSNALGKEHGMLSTECAAGTQPAAWRDHRGALWFPTLEGVSRLDPADLRPNLVAPPVLIESVLVDGVAQEPRAALRLAPGKERIELTYAGLSLRVPERVRFRYQLEGFDRDWVAAGDARSTTFTNLPRGRHYRFVVTAANSDGVWNTDGASLSFYVERRFYETPMFVALLGALILVLGRGAYRARLRHLLRRTQELEHKVAERTAEVVAEKERVEAANQELEKLNRMKSEFLAIAAHDLKNPLSVVYGYCGLIAKQGQAIGRVRKMARSISGSVNQMLNTINDLLDTTAIESGKLRLSSKLVDLAPLVAEVVVSNGVRAAERGIRLKLDVEAEDLYLSMVDEEKISRVFDNLISNAIKFSSDRQCVDVSLAKVWHGGRKILRFSVRDRGPGLSEEDQRKLFQRFERLSARPVAGDSSTGLGLSIVKQFVELHGGEVLVESDLGRGSTFTVDLAAATGDQHSPQDAAHLTIPQPDHEALRQRLERST